MQIFIIRHTPVLKDLSVCHGQYDFPLILSEYEKYLNLYKKNFDYQNTKIYTSPLERCLKLAINFNKEYKIQHELAEFSYGDWEGKKWEDINPKHLENWMTDYFYTSPPNGESLQMFILRITNYLQDLSKNNEDAILITHLGVMRAILSMTLNIPIKDFFNIDIGYGALIQLELGVNQKIRLKKFLSYQ